MYKTQRMMTDAVQPQKDVATADDEAADKRHQLLPNNVGYQHHRHYNQHYHQQQHNNRHQQQYDPERRHHKKQYIYTQHPNANPLVRQPLHQHQQNTIGRLPQQQERHRPICKKQPTLEALSTAASTTLKSVKETFVSTDTTSAKENLPPPPQPKPCLDRAALLPTGIRDVDRRDNCIMVSAYAKEIFVYLAELELRYTLPENFLAGHDEVSERSRTVLVDWLIQLSCKLDLQADTFHLGVRLLDHYLATDHTVTKQQLQLLGATAIWLASKFEEVYCISISDLQHVCAGACNRRELMSMEVRLICALDFQLLPPLPITFLRRLSKVASVDNQLHSAAKYLLELATLSARLAWRPASLLAAAALRVALGSKGREWCEMLVFYSGYALSDLLGVSAEMARACVTAAASASLLTAPDTSGGIGSIGKYYQYVYQKYRSPKSFGVSACPQLRADSQYLADLIAQGALPSAARTGAVDYKP